MSKTRIEQPADIDAARAAEILDELQAMANPAAVEGMARYGMSREKRLGVSVPNMRRLAKKVGKDHGLALALWITGIPEARITASMVAVPEQLTESQMDEWARDFDSWDVCDQVCMNLFDKSPFAVRKIVEWSVRDEEFVKRAAFALLACLAWHDQRMTDDEFFAFMPVIKRGATDERNFVKKAVNWALRTIGKRSLALNEAAVQTAKEMQNFDSKAARWIAADALRELESDKVRQRLVQFR